MEYSRNKIARLLKERYGYKIKETMPFLNDFEELVEELIQNGDKIVFHGFGTLEPVVRKERWTLDFNTKEKVVIPEHFVIKFTPGKKLKFAARMAETTRVCQPNTNDTYEYGNGYGDE